MNSDLPVKKKDEFLAEIEVMDLSKIKDKTFLVAVATGHEEKSIKFLCSTIHGPYTYIEMLQEVGDMWANHQHHARVIVCGKDATKEVEMLDINTVDYIELNHTDLITEEMLGGAFDKEFTCQAGLITEEESTDPRHKVLTASPNEESDAP